MLTIGVPMEKQDHEGEVGILVSVLFEHSLFSISKWEEKWHVSFFDESDKTEEQLFDYFRCMLVDESDARYLDNLTEENLSELLNYIANPATATKIYSMAPTKTGHKKVTTTEELYFQMFSRQIPMECEHWHINRLIMLLQLWDIYNADPKKSRMSKQETREWYAKENARRRALLKQRKG